MAKITRKRSAHASVPVNIPGKVLVHSIRETSPHSQSEESPKPCTNKRKQKFPVKSFPRGVADTQPGIVFTLPHLHSEPSLYRGILVRVITPTSDLSPCLPNTSTITPSTATFEIIEKQEEEQKQGVLNLPRPVRKATATARG